MPEPYETFIDNKLREAEERGLFRDLPGQGKPLQFSTEDVRDPKNWLAHHMLKNAGLLPAWVDLAKEIDGYEDRIQALERDYVAWLDDEAARLAGLSEARLRPRLPGVRAIYVRFIERYQTLLSEAQERKQRFNYDVPVRSLEKFWPSLEGRLRDFQNRARALLTGPDLAELPPAEIEQLVAFPPSTREHFKDPVSFLNGAGSVLMAGASRSNHRERLLQHLSEVAAIVSVKRPNGRR